MSGGRLPAYSPQTVRRQLTDSPQTARRQPTDDLKGNIRLNFLAAKGSIFNLNPLPHVIPASVHASAAE